MGFSGTQLAAAGGGSSPWMLHKQPRNTDAAPRMTPCDRQETYRAVGRNQYLMDAENGAGRGAKCRPTQLPHCGQAPVSQAATVLQTTPEDQDIMTNNHKRPLALHLFQKNLQPPFLPRRSQRVHTMPLVTHANFLVLSVLPATLCLLVSYRAVGGRGAAIPQQGS